MKKILGFATFMAFITSASMLDGIYGDAAFNVMLVAGAILISMGIATEKKGAASDGTLNGSKKSS